MRLLLALGLVLAASAAPALAQDEGTTGSVISPDPEPGTKSLWAQIGFYDHADDGDGNPFLDEALTVIEPVLIWDHQVSEDWGYALTFSYDNVSSASIERLSKFPEQSGASGDYYFGLDYASRHRLDSDRRFSWNVGGSVEYDYKSLGGGLAYETENRTYGSTTSWSLQSYYDIVDVIRFDGSDDEGQDSRLSVTGGWSYDRPLSPKWIASLKTIVAFQSGFLETPYNAVVLEDPGLPPNPNLDNMARGIEVTEELPDTRVRGSVKLTGRRWVGEGRSVELGGRVYADDWGIFAVSAEPRFQMQLGERARMRLRYRYYVQTEADYFSDSFAGTVPGDAPKYRTQDSDLGAFDAHTFGIRFDLLSAGLPRVTLDLNYTIREDGLDHVYALLGYRIF